MRLLVVWCPDWPVTAACIAAGVPGDHPAAVFSANRVVACSAVARRNGVRRGMRRRQAQSSCPEVAVLGVDPARDARLFEPVAAAVEALAVGVDVVRPGVVAVPVAGALAYFGSEMALAERLVDRVSGEAGVECSVGVADGMFAAVLAARRGVVVAPGETPQFLAPLPITELSWDDGDREELVDLLRRLGLRTLGDFAALSERTVASRFGMPGLIAHRMARGAEERPLARRKPPAELAVVETFDPPIDRVDAAAFVARRLGEQLHAQLAARDMACTQLGIYAATEGGEELAKVWRCAGWIGPSVADRVRWQLDGWLQKATLTGGVVTLRLEPEEVIDTGMLQLGLWPGRGGGDGADGDEDADERAGRALVRVQGLLGPDRVCTPVLTGGRGPVDRVRLVPWGEPREGTDARPWPGRLPAPSPPTVFGRPVAASVVDARGSAVGLTGRSRLTGAPAAVAVDGRPPRRVVGWAGPWPVDERWWEPMAEGIRARVQVVVDPGDAYLLLYRAEQRPQWLVEGEY